MGQTQAKSKKRSRKVIKISPQIPAQENFTPPPPKEMEEPVKSKPEANVDGPQLKNPEVQLGIFFSNYRDEESDQIMAEGIEKFCNDLKVDPTDFVMLAIAFKFEAKQMCLFTREQFVNGCKSLDVCNLKELKKTLPSLKSEFQNQGIFKKLYYFTFEFGLEHGQRILPLEMAIPLWQCVFQGGPPKPKIFDKWLNFLQQSEGKSISKDTWQMFYHFLENVKPDLSNYDDSDAWPSLFDDFFEFEKEKNTKTA